MVYRGNRNVVHKFPSMLEYKSDHDGDVRRQDLFDRDPDPNDHTARRKTDKARPARTTPVRMQSTTQSESASTRCPSLLRKF